MENVVPDIDEVHKVLLDILKAVASLCEKHNIRYSLYCGTLLGAVRHRGFIPWDHDVDLTMPWPDYQLFLEHADELPAGFTCIHRKNVRDFRYIWARVVAEGTTFMNKDLAALDIPRGLFVDIYPMIGTPSSALGRKLQKRLIYVMRVLQQASSYPVRNYSGRGKLIKMALGSCPHIIRQVFINMLAPFCLLDPGKAERIGTIDGAPFEGKYRRKSWQEMEPLRFEDAYFLAPAQYDIILRRMYGDYMKLPPKEARIVYFEKDNIIIDPHRDYRLYRKELLGK